MSNIILIRNKIPEVPCDLLLVAENTGLTIQFDFDDEWSAFASKTAVVRIANTKTEIVFTGDTIELPMLPSSVKYIDIGVYAGDLSTTAPARIRVIPSILGISQGARPYDPDDPGNIPDAVEVTADDTLIISDVSAGKRVKAKVSDLLAAIAVPEPSDDQPLVDGEPSAGNSRYFARSDHRHPTDTTRASKQAVEAALNLKADAPYVITFTEVTENVFETEETAEHFYQAAYEHAQYGKPINALICRIDGSAPDRLCEFDDSCEHYTFSAVRNVNVAVGNRSVVTCKAFTFRFDIDENDHFINAEYSIFELNDKSRQALTDEAQDIAIAGKLSETGTAYRAAAFPKGECAASSTATAFSATVEGITALYDGVCVWLKNGVVTSAVGFTIDINGLGAKPVYISQAEATAATTTFNKSYTALLVYNSTRVSGGCWDYVYGYDTNTTYTPASLGFGYAECSTAEATAAKTASIGSYKLTAGGIVAIKFANAVGAGATLNITSKGAKAIYYKGAPITAGVIKAGDTVTMIYSTYYHVLSIDRDEAPVSSVNGQTGDVTLAIPSTAEDVGAASAPKYTTLTLATSDWQTSGSAFSCSKTVTGMTATSIVWLSYSDTETEFSESQSASTLTFTVVELPSEAITVNVAFMEGSALS